MTLKTLSNVIIDRLILNEERYGVEVQNAFLSLIVGTVFLFDHSNLYNRYPDTYRYMEFAPAWIWGVIFGGAGLFHLFTLAFNLSYLRKRALLIKSGVWIFISVCVVSADVWAVSGYFYIVFAFMAFKGSLKIVLKSKGKS